MTPQPDGAVLVSPGRPVEWLTVEDFARAVGVARSTVYPQIGGEAIPAHMVRYPGPRLIQISAEAVAHFKAYWSERRGDR